MRPAAATVLMLAAAGPLAAQDAVPLTFSPGANEVVHRLFQAHTRITLAGPDAGVRESAHLGGMTQVVLARRADDAVLHLAFDSLRSRVRVGGGAWQERAVGSADELWVQVGLDRQLRTVATPGGADNPGAGLLVQFVTGIAGLVLPERPIVAGARWEQRLAVPLTAMPEDLPPELARTAVPVHVTVTVDSLVPRASDTLVYLGVRGSVEQDPIDRTLSIVGEVSGALTWSTGWHGFVAAATRTRVEVSSRAPEDPPRRLVIETTLRASVHP